MAKAHAAPQRVTVAEALGLGCLPKRRRQALEPRCGFADIVQGNKEGNCLVDRRSVKAAQSGEQSGEATMLGCPQNCARDHSSVNHVRKKRMRPAGLAGLAPQNAQIPHALKAPKLVDRQISKQRRVCCGQTSGDYSIGLGRITQESRRREIRRVASMPTEHSPEGRGGTPGTRALWEGKAHMRPASMDCPARGQAKWICRWSSLRQRRRCHGRQSVGSGPTFCQILATERALGNH